MLSTELPATLANALIGLSCLLTVVGFFGRHHFLADLASHFRVQYLIIQISGTLWLAFDGHILTTVLVLPFLVMNLPKVLPHYGPSPTDDTHISSGIPCRRLTLLHINVLFRTWNFDGVLRYIDKVQPDLLSLHEMNAKWLSALESRLSERFPHYQINRQAESALFSKIPFDTGELVHTTDPAEDPLSGVIVARMHVESVPLTVMLTHTDTPIHPWRFRRQQRHLEGVGRMIRADRAENLILVGDLNTTPFSANYRLLLETSGLRDARTGFGLRPTWPVYIPVAMIPLDHCLYRGKLHVRQYRLGPFNGSDHLPIELVFEL